MMVFLSEEFPAALTQVTTDYEVALESAEWLGAGRSS